LSYPAATSIEEEKRERERKREIDREREREKEGKVSLESADASGRCLQTKDGTSELHS
jgi:hypothetical protein